MPLLNNGEEQPPLANFVAQIPAAFKANDAEAFAELIATDKFNTITVYGGEGVVYKVAHQNKNKLTIKNLSQNYF